jgi:2-amino-4-hydroxy-6-hydroxymethyldihydropteridine diphosphokinase
MVTCYLGIGSNLGNRAKNIGLAVKEISALKRTKIIKTSTLIETKPVGGPLAQPKFLNAALKINTALSASAILKELKIIEKRLGRMKTVRNGPRMIDIDILLYGDKVINTKRLIIPHPRMFKREFVIRPLSEII